MWATSSKQFTRLSVVINHRQSFPPFPTGNSIVGGDLKSPQAIAIVSAVLEGFKDKWEHYYATKSCKGEDPQNLRALCHPRQTMVFSWYVCFFILLYIFHGDVHFGVNESPRSCVLPKCLNGFKRLKLNIFINFFSQDGQWIFRGSSCQILKTKGDNIIIYTVQAGSYLPGLDGLLASLPGTLIFAVAVHLYAPLKNRSYIVLQLPIWD